MLGTIVYFLFGIAEALLTLRIILHLIGANAANAFVSWVYNFSQPLVTPFSSIINQPSATAIGPGAVTSSVIDWAAIIALVIIVVIGAVIGRIAYHPRHMGV
jgi:hypothetical protein